MGATAKASPQGLEKVKQATKKRGWHKTSPAFLDAARVSAATLKRFWRGIAIGIESFQSICQAVNVDFDQVVELDESAEVVRSPLRREATSSVATAKNLTSDLHLNVPSIICEAADPDSRDRLRQSLYNQLLDSVRVLAITGLTGIGKTTLAHQLADDLQAKEYSTIYLTCDSTVPLTLTSVVHAISKYTQLDSFTLSLSELSDRLFSQKYLFILDNFEHLLTDEPNWEQTQSSLWHKFFQSVLNAPSCSSRFILTTQNTPNQIASLGRQHPARWHLCALAGLTITEQSNLFQHQGLAEAQQSDILAEIGKTYAGHPLALQTVAQDIAENYQGQAFTYWQHHTADNLHSQSPRLQQTVQLRLVQTIARLQNHIPDAFTLLGSLSRSEQPVDCLQIIQTGQDLNLATGHCRSLLDALCDRAFLTPTILQNRLHFYPHPLVRSLMLTQIHGTPNPTNTTTKQSAHIGTQPIA